ncbi:hypothetical protein DE146DRAFT_778560 [Phaeosphaeria sp. MPI-PUGE-AT-0046c]|nr:hypothetical protein DE146DRAFT_778560 [Phaeosphaeria sp. MPI-PUGE-AT-0046c]
MISRRKRTKLLATTLLLLIVAILYFTHSISHHTLPEPNAESKKAGTTLEVLEWRPDAPPRISIAATSYLNANTRSLALWSAYALRFDHKLHVQNNPVVRGFANPLIWLHHVITVEMMNDSGTRAEWIVYFNPSATFHSNPSLPLTHFLPPSSFPSFSTLTFLGTKSNGFDVDTSFFYMRVSSLSLRILTLAMAAVYLEPQREWGSDVAGAALREVLEREEYRDKVAWLPAQWWDRRDAVFVKPRLREGGLGLLDMEKVLENAEEGFQIDEAEVYPSKGGVEAFWNMVGEARLVLETAEEKKHESGEVGSVQETRELRDVVELKTSDISALRSAIAALKESSGLGDIVGFESVIR